MSTTNANARKTHCPRGHEYDDQNTKYENNRNGSVSRKCKSCISIRLKKKYVEITRALKVKNAEMAYRPMNVKHGDFGTRLYRIWAHMKARCFNDNCFDYRDYGARGISVCAAWQDYKNFAKWARENGYDKNLTIDRIDNDGNYEPSNCRWATPKQQANNKRNNRVITYCGVTKTLQEWADYLDIETSALRYRLNNWESIDRAFSEPLQGTK